MVRKSYHILFLCLSGCVLCLLLLVILLPNNNSQDAKCECLQTATDSHIDDDSQRDHLAVVVPFRNRFEEMQEFVPYLHKFLFNQNVPHEIFIVNQVRKLGFYFLL